MPSTPGDFYIILSRVVMRCYLDSRMVNAKQLQNFKSLGNTLGVLLDDDAVRFYYTRFQLTLRHFQNC